MSARRLVIATAVVASLLFSIAGDTADAPPGLSAVAYDIPDWFKQSFLEIQEDAAEAAAEDRHLLLFMHLDGCPYCARVLEENFAGGPNQAFIQDNFDCVALNILGDREVVFNDAITLSEKALARRLKVFHTPAVLFLDGRGEVVARLNGYRNPDRFRTVLEFVRSKSYQHQALADFAASETNVYALRDHPNFSTSADLHAVATPLMVIFEDAACRSCDRLHAEYLNRPEIRRLLDRITVVRLDAHSTKALVDPGGARTSPRDWVRRLHLDYRPGIVFFDGESELARIESMLSRYHFETTLMWVADRAFQRVPDLRQFARAREQALIEAGRDIDMSF